MIILIFLFFSDDPSISYGFKASSDNLQQSTSLSSEPLIFAPPSSFYTGQKSSNIDPSPLSDLNSESLKLGVHNMSKSFSQKFSWVNSMGTGIKGPLFQNF